MCDVFDLMFNLACCSWANKLVYANKLDSCHGTTWQSLVARSLPRYATRLGSKPLAVICKMLSIYPNLIFALGRFDILNRASAMHFNFTSHVFSNLGPFIPGHWASITKEAVLVFSSYWTFPKSLFAFLCDARHSSTHCTSCRMFHPRLDF